MVSESRSGMNTTELQQFTVLQTNQLQLQANLRDFKLESKEELGGIRADIKHLDKLVFEGDGNGMLPLTERTRNSEAFIKSVRFWFRTIAVALVVQTITFGAAAAVYFIKLYPLLENISRNP